MKYAGMRVVRLYLRVNDIGLTCMPMSPNKLDDGQCVVRVTGWLGSVPTRVGISPGIGERMYIGSMPSSSQGPGESFGRRIELVPVPANYWNHQFPHQNFTRTRAREL
jgi:hypothetical protein